MMSSEYIRARSKAPSEDTLYRITVDEKPYFPNFVVDPQNEDSIKTAASLCVHSMNGGSELSIKKVTGGNTNLLYRVTKITGGITNQLYKVNVDECLAVLVRIFGAPGLIDRDVENSVYAALSEIGIAPPYHGRFANGRVEGWLEMRPLNVPELSVFNKQIAEKLARLHVDFVPATSMNEEPTMWTQLRSWMDQALVAKFKNESDEQRARDLDLKSLPSELDWLQDSVVPKDSKTAFCHNDALAANFLVSADSKDIQLIDFEYGGTNFVAFDIANHFNEYAGGTDHGVPDYGLFPNNEKQQEFIRSYLKASQGIEATDAEVDVLHTEVQAYILVNHHYWGLWAVNQASTEGCDDFDYLLYAKHRIGRYRATKSK